MNWLKNVAWVMDVGFAGHFDPCKIQDDPSSNRTKSKALVALMGHSKGYISI